MSTPIWRRLRNLVISVCYLGMSCPIRRVKRALGSGPSCIVVYYHGVRKSEVPQFRWQMDQLLRAARPARVPFGNTFYSGDRYFAVTFDDGFVSTIEHGLPELVSRNIPATLFVPADYLGRVPQWDHSAGGAATEIVAAANVLRALPQELFSFGSHTMTHANMVTSDHDAAAWELGESRRLLESVLKCSITLFAFPYGKFTPAVAKMARDAGYQHVFTSEPSLTPMREQEWLIGRVSVTPNDWPLEFWLKIRGAYNWQSMLHLLRVNMQRRLNRAQTAVKSHWEHRIVQKIS